MEETLTAARDAVSAITHKGYTFLDNNLTPTNRSYADVCREAKQIAARLQALGLSKGDRLALILHSPENFVLSFLGTISAGLMPVPIYPPLVLGRLDNYLDRATGILQVSGAKALLTTKELLSVFQPALSRTASLQSLWDVETLRQTREAPVLNENISQPDEPCFLQFTSGSTAAPRGVIVTHRNLIANARAIIKCIEIDSEKDRAVSWLPLYHDMGLIGFVIATLVAQIPVVFIPTISFIKHPGVWMDTVHKYRATMTCGPNFAFDLAAKRAPKNSRTNLDLSCLRVLGCGAEPINPKTMENFITTYAPWGLKANALLPCYGMAEATLAIAFDRLNRPAQKLAIDRQAYETENIARPVGNNGNGQNLQKRVELVSCGRAIPGHEIAILNDCEQALPEGRIGEIVFRGPSVTPGYFENPEASGQLLKNGWLHTGDLGFILNGDLYISGRQKDLVIINGRNYPPQAIEWVTEEISGIRKGNVVAFSVNGNSTEKLIIVAETAIADTSDMAKAISDQVRSALGLVVDKVVLVGRGSIPKTSSGKLQRGKTKALFEDGLLGAPRENMEMVPPKSLFLG